MLLAVLLVLSPGAFGRAESLDIEQQARELEAALIAPCCFSQQVSVHQSPAAAEARADIRRRLRAGETPDQIIQAYVAEYGNRVLAQPPDTGLNRLLYLLPPFALLLTAMLVAVAVRRYTARASASAREVSTTACSPENRYHAELDRQLDDLD